MLPSLVGRVHPRLYYFNALPYNSGCYLGGRAAFPLQPRDLPTNLISILLEADEFAGELIAIDTGQDVFGATGVAIKTDQDVFGAVDSSRTVVLNREQ